MTKYCETLDNKMKKQGEENIDLAKKICNIDPEKCEESLAKELCGNIAKDKKDKLDCYCGIYKNKKGNMPTE